MKAQELLERIKNLPDGEEFFYKEKDGTCVVTNEWLIGNFAGDGFEGETFEEAAEKMIAYFDRHIGHQYESMVGRIVAESGWPNLNSVFDYVESEKTDLGLSKEDLFHALEKIAEHIAMVGYPANSKGLYDKNGEWNFDKALPHEADAEEIKKAFYLAENTIARAKGE